MRAALSLVAFTAISVLNVPVLGQQATQSMRLPRPTNWSATDLAVSVITGITVCDPSPNVYLRLVKRNQPVVQAPFRIMRPNGESIEVEPATALPDRLIITAFGVDPDGNLYATLQLGHSPQWYTARFDQNGKFIGKAPLSEKLTPFFILPLRDHRAVIGGVRPATSAEEQHVASLVGLFDTDGQMLRSLSLPDDDKEEEVTKQEVGKHTFYSVNNRAVERGRAVLGADGTVYIFRASSIPKVQVLDAEGNTRRVFSLVPPGSDALPSDFYVFGNSIAVGYFESKQENVCLTEGNLALYDPISGMLTANFVVPLSPDVFLCAQNHSLIYLKALKTGPNYQRGHIEVPALDHVSESARPPHPQ
jgi:hypothetical protein